MSQIIRSKKDLKKAISKIKDANSTIGLVPTMGALHSGHLSLVQMSKLQYDVTVVTIFVNPVQFNNSQDLEKYPRTEQDDIELLINAECDIIFIPKANEIYELKPTIELSFGYLETIMEGDHRPGHFKGVGLIVMKLFGLVEPNGAYFGQKDLQQFRVISTLVEDFELAITLHMAPIVREVDGLAMSSRNKRLTKTGIGVVSLIYSSLKEAEKSLRGGSNVIDVKLELKELFESENSIDLEYFEIVKLETLQNISVVNEGDRLALCIAAYVAEVRLIDNIIIEI